MSVKTLIAENKLDAAAVEIAEGIRHILSRAGLGIDLTKDQFYTIMPNVINILTEGLPAAGEATDDPGDDVVVQASKATLTIKFVGPEDDDNFDALPDFTKIVAVGAKYTFAPYTVVGYTPDKALVTGTMTAEGNVVTVTYTKDAEDETTEPAVTTSKVTVAITYVGPANDTDFIAPDDYLEEFDSGDTYSVTSPTVTGYTPDKATVSGTASEDVEITVTYTKDEIEDPGQEISD